MAKDHISGGVHDARPENTRTVAPEDRRPSLIEQGDAKFGELEQRARRAITAGEEMVSVDPVALLGAMARLDSYREMAGLSRQPRRL